MAIAHEHGGNVFAVARNLGLAPERIIDFSASINPLGMAPGVREALTASLDRLLHYPDKGAAELKQALAAYHGVEPSQIAVANGSTELIHLLPRTFQGKKALVVAPAFAEYALALERAGWQIEYFTLSPADDFALDVAALAQRVADGYDMLFLCNPGNPAGNLQPLREIAGVVDLCRESGTFLVLDEAFIDFCEEESAKHLVVRNPRAVLLRSMTKFFGIPGLRLGYAIAAAETVAEIAAQQDPWSVNTAAQVAGIASLADQDYCRRTRSYVDEERARLAAALADVPGLKVFPGRANYLLVRILRAGVSAGQLREALLAKGMMIRDCSNFQGLDASFFRVAVRLEEENDLLLRGLATELA
ncbi:threonine-phosphate decarboxylase CobD [Geomonas nitrogeniifigens]|uniref:threonine-phosphate decarboxylase CobD n=1 Tax=Geomonas diazotrophica TaxID=2843197 RepID=UPI001C2C4AC6|nr:threonine-phosphate decarboxylase CobD [Geomonas nitrogeniifigens]QXE86049.1 threonine-phosphate decarboxylase CobD [Geomonas nitrogeniifigens]